MDTLPPSPMPTLLPIQCRCGRLRGTLAAPARAVPLICYCRDCQTAAHAIGEPQRTLDGNGGTSILASVQSRLAFTDGRDQLACLSLTDHGLLRWHSRCCATPIANTVRRPQMSFVGIVHACLGASAAEWSAAWPTPFAVFTRHAKRPVDTSSFALLRGSLAIARWVLAERLTGGWQQSPFFQGEGSAQPASEVRVLTPAELADARQAV